MIFHYGGHIARFSGVNIGDYIQSIATKNALSSISNNSYSYFDRDSINFYNPNFAENEAGGQICIMQGWFAESLRFLPSSYLFPLFIGTHFAKKAQDFLLHLNAINPYYFESKEIGCRDLCTLEFCKKVGFSAYLSRCLTLTLPKRLETKEQTQIFLVSLDTKHIELLPKQISQNANIISQQNIQLPSNTYKSYFQKAQDLLNLYKDKAKLVITSALHCAAPCVAMEIPTILIAKDEENFTRFSALDGILKIHTQSDLKEGKINYEVESKNIERLKEAMLKNLHLSINKLCKKEADLKELQEIREFIANFKV
ncbi:MAG: polysaccharide pyruvyl transferase family protein [Helicobacteraceae bacterium]|nr:polysaccharide pyruvyl transferase family protein [Helicobacteraceae bacterium]